MRMILSGYKDGSGYFCQLRVEGEVDPKSPDDDPNVEKIFKLVGDTDSFEFQKKVLEEAKVKGFPENKVKDFFPRHPT